MLENSIELAAGFAPANEAAWRAVVEKSLRGAAFEAKLTTRTRDGLVLQPLYPQTAPGFAIAGRPAGRPWKVVQSVDDPDLDRANAQIHDDLSGGADALELVVAGANAGRPGGLVLETVDDLAKLLDGVRLDAIELRIRGRHHGRHLTALLMAHCARAGIDPAALTLCLGADPIGSVASAGRIVVPVEEAARFNGDMWTYLAAAGVNGPLFLADGRVWHDGGASELQELAFVAATIVSYLRSLERSGLGLTDAVARIEVALAADADQFATIAKFRAMRLIWNRLLEGCGLQAIPLRLHAETAWRMMTRRDPNVNMLRAAIACFAAGIGGADSISVLPFSAPLGLADGFARRVARNTQMVLLEESNLYRVADPAAGSGYVDTLTADLAAAAWARFQRIEAEGGILAALRAGTIQADIKAVRTARMADIATRREPLTGTSEFPDLGAVRVSVLAVDEPDFMLGGTDLTLPEPDGGSQFAALVAAADAGAGLSDMATARKNDPETVAAVPAHRLAEPYEALRDHADEIALICGHAPRIFLATLGTAAGYGPRATWARNFFAAGGIAALGGEPYGDAATAAAAFRDSGARIACLCASDDTYGEMAVDAAGALRAAGAGHVFLAGKPGERKDELAAAGIGTFVHVGCNLPDVLTAALALA